MRLFLIVFLLVVGFLNLWVAEERNNIWNAAIGGGDLVAALFLMAGA